MDAITEWFNDRRYSQIIDRHPDPKVFPNFYKANRQEFILRPGEMIFIPAGMFHFVFSEDPDPETGLCAAINFWYDNNGKGDEGDPDEKAKFGWHDIHLHFDEILNIIRPKKMKVYTSPFKCFPPDFMKHRYPEISYSEMSFNDFYKAKNSEHYIAQYKCTEFDKFAVPHNSSLKDSSVWINWGNCNTLPHYDGMDNWLCQIKGTRRVILVPQSDRNLMYIINPYPMNLLNFIFKNIDKLRIKNPLQVNVNFCKSRDEYNKFDIIIPSESKSNTHKQVNYKQNVISRETINQISRNFEKYSEVYCVCKEFELSYTDEIRSYGIRRNAKKYSYKSKQYTENENIIINDPNIGVIWFITDGKVKIEETNISAKAGSVISFPTKLDFSVKVLSNCIITIPDNGSRNGN